jgi:hypothetical protein
LDERTVECTACHNEWKEAPGAAAGPCPSCGKTGTRLVHVQVADASVATDAVLELALTRRPITIVKWRWMIPTVVLAVVGPGAGLLLGVISPIVGIIGSLVLGLIGLGVGLKAGGERVVIEHYRNP